MTKAEDGAQAAEVVGWMLAGWLVGVVPHPTAVQFWSTPPDADHGTDLQVTVVGRHAGLIGLWVAQTDPRWAGAREIMLTELDGTGDVQPQCRAAAILGRPAAAAKLFAALGWSVRSERGPS